MPGEKDSCPQRAPTRIEEDLCLLASRHLHSILGEPSSTGTLVFARPLRRRARGTACRPTGPMSPMNTVAVQDIVHAVLYLTEARQVTGEVLHVDGGGHVGKW